jgi:hypothetical protein
MVEDEKVLLEEPKFVKRSSLYSVESVDTPGLYIGKLVSRRRCALYAAKGMSHQQ